MITDKIGSVLVDIPLYSNDYCCIVKVGADGSRFYSYDIRSNVGRSIVKKQIKKTVMTLKNVDWLK